MLLDHHETDDAGKNNHPNNPRLGRYAKLAALLRFFVSVVYFILFVVSHVSVAQATMPAAKSQPRIFCLSVPLPEPLQTPRRLGSQLEPLCNAQTFNPNNFSAHRRRHHQSPAHGSRNFLVREQILKLDRMLHADGLKAIARLPMPQNNRRTDFVRVKKLRASSAPARQSFSRIQTPTELRATKTNLPGPALRPDIHQTIL